MKHVDLLVIGFGKAGKTLASFAAEEGKTVAVVEKSEKMYGGTCINVACIPSKTLIHDAEANKDFMSAMSRKSDVVDALNDKNYHNLADNDNIEVLDYTAKFKSNKVVNLLNDQGTVVDEISADYVVINSGSKPNIPDIEGIDDSEHIYDSTSIMGLTSRPNHLVIIGAGYIALEFASMFSQFGTEVTVLEREDTIMPGEDREVVEAVVENLEEQGVTFVFDAEPQSFISGDMETTVETSAGNYKADAILVATGRGPNTDLDLENTDVTLDDDGSIVTGEHLETDASGVYAVGDVKGGMQFTYISLDDFRIVRDHMFGDAARTTENRGAVPYTVFVNPPLARVGLTAEAAREDGYDILEGKVPVNAIPRHKVNDDARGIFKVVIDKKTEYILGATLYGVSSEELINLVKLAMEQNISYTVLRDMIYTHPTMAESFNNLFDVN